MHVRPMQFSILCTPTDSSDKTQLMCSTSTTLLCLFTSKYDINGSRLNYSTVFSNKLIFKSCARTKQGVLIVALKKTLEIRWGICLYCIKRHFCIDPMTILVVHQAVPPTFYNKFAPMGLRMRSVARNRFSIKKFSIDSLVCHHYGI